MTDTEWHSGNVQNYVSEHSAATDDTASSRHCQVSRAYDVAHLPTCHPPPVALHAAARVQ